jgi:hypothetical protein
MTMIPKFPTGQFGQNRTKRVIGGSYPIKRFAVGDVLADDEGKRKGTVVARVRKGENDRGETKIEWYEEGKKKGISFLDWGSTSHFRWLS